jgi:uncharacterized protein YjbI with pentapeptide repeats
MAVRELLRWHQAGEREFVEVDLDGTDLGGADLSSANLSDSNSERYGVQVARRR